MNTMQGKTAKNKVYSNLYVKRRLMKLEIDIFAIMSQGLVKGTPKRKILADVKKQILDLAVLLNLSDLEKNRIWLNAYKQYQELVKKCSLPLRKAGSDVEARNEIVYNCIRAKIQNNDLIKEANEVMYDYEYRTKHEAMYGAEGLLETARENTKSPFFLCSSHPEPAVGHQMWEGKVFFDEEWEDYVPDADKAACRAYIRNRKLRTVQWVCGEPVWMVLRRNCKHYLKNIPIQEVLHSSPRALLKKHGMIHPGSAPVPRKILYYREYYNRLKLEEQVNELIPNKKLTQDVKKDKKLLEKWKRVL